MYDLLAPVVLATTGTSTPAWLSSVDFSGLETTAESLAGVVAPVIVTIMGIVIGIKLLKKFGNKIG